ncbi:MAG TPA: selenocysteine-specific translation elongation factor, partial [Planctomycetaceae bacterium]|nr:selenocysteine-specific translation elongation factor [Planctomycetaceae bacterium]
WSHDGFEFGIVDVPGHERFIRNMTAGATGIDIALLVVAADDGVMPQTREHLEILQALGIRTGVIAITKIDLAEPELVEYVRDELRELVAGTFLADAPIVPVSSETGAGFDTLGAALCAAASQSRAEADSGLFRMPIDRAFSIAGHGTIVSGTVLGGTVAVGETVELLPAGIRARVRSIHRHGVEATSSSARRRTALNLVGVKADDIHRGDEVVAPNCFHTTRRLLVRLEPVRSAPLPLRDRMELKLHLGTAEVSARVVLKSGELKAGESGFGELRLKSPVVAQYGQHFILRRASPALTLAGGTVLDPNFELRRVRDYTPLGTAAESGSERERLARWLARSPQIDLSAAAVTVALGINTDQCARLLADLQATGEIVRINGKSLVHRERLEVLSSAAMRKIRDEIAQRQPCRSLPKTVLLNACRTVAEPPIGDAVLERLIKSRQLAQVGDQYGPAELQVKLTKQQAKLQQAMLERIAADGLMPPFLREFAVEFGVEESVLLPLVELPMEDGQLVRICPGYYVTPAALDAGVRTCREVLHSKGEATMSELRAAWNATRKYSVPLCEWLDSKQITVRDGDIRRPGPKFS